MNVREYFRDAMSDAGIATDDRIIPDGRLHRIRVKGDQPGSRNGWYVLHDDTPAAGAFGCWKRGISETWKVSRERWPCSEVGQEELRMRENQRKQEQRDLAARRRTSARERATRDWARAHTVDAKHPYLLSKRIKPYIAKQIGDRLQIPVRSADGDLLGLQRIGPDGKKRFLVGTEVKGAYCSLGRVGEVLILCEGYATGSTLHEATGLPVAVCFSANNLRPAAESIRSKLGHKVRMIFAADDDRMTSGNPGLAAAREASESINGVVAVPEFEPGSEGGDFNDLARVHGLEVVRRCIHELVIQARERWSLPELLRETFPDPVWVIDSVLPEGLGIFIGPPKTGKSRMATSIALSVGAGGFAVGGLKSFRGDVLYIDLEQGPRASQQRFNEILAGGTIPSGVTIVYKWPLLGEGFVAALERDLRENRSIRLVIIDTLARVWSTANTKQRGNAYHQEYEALSRIKSIADQFGVCILALHHESKVENPDKLYRASGTIAMTGVPDTIWILSRKRGQAGAELYVTGREVRERTIPLIFDGFMGTWVVSDEAVETATN